MKEFVTIKVNKKTLDEIKSVYHAYLFNNPGEYIYFCAKKGDITIIGYESNKINKTITFDGPGALKEARKFDPNAILKENDETQPVSFIDFNDQIGSDEVGNGDFLFPMIIAAAYVKKSQMARIKELKIGDSKKISDQRIKILGPIVMKEFAFSRMILPNNRYNEMILKGDNLNSLKARMHNGALNNLILKFPYIKNIYVDQFCDPKTYYHYLKNEKEIINQITFKTKGESYYPCVALASIIARYTLLQVKEQLDNKYQLDFPFGAGKKVDEFSLRFIEKYSLQELESICKKNFKNYKLL